MSDIYKRISLGTVRKFIFGKLLLKKIENMQMLSNLYVIQMSWEWKKGTRGRRTKKGQIFSNLNKFQKFPPIFPIFLHKNRKNDERIKRFVPNSASSIKFIMKYFFNLKLNNTSNKYNMFNIRDKCEIVWALFSAYNSTKKNRLKKIFSHRSTFSVDFMISYDENPL